MYLFHLVLYYVPVVLSLKHIALGINKYSHNACVVVVEINKEREEAVVRFAQEKERLSRVKNDGGAVGDLIWHGLRASGIDESSEIVAVAANNHHTSIADMEAVYREADMHGISGGSELWPEVDQVLDPANLLESCTNRVEVSHQYAHALGSVVMCPFLNDDNDKKTNNKKTNIAVVFDGMGECAARFRDENVISDATLCGWERCQHILGNCALNSFDQVPDTARETESIYLVHENQQLQPLWKRWCLARPAEPLGYRDWFLSPCDSLGAAYSYVSHVIFGDWNACGKVMGLAPWGAYATLATESFNVWGASSRQTWAKLLEDYTDQTFLDSLVSTEKLFVYPNNSNFRQSGCRVDRDVVQRILKITANKIGGITIEAPLVGLWNLGNDVIRASCAVLAYVVQLQLEEMTLPWILHFGNNAHVITFSGGVALNSVLIGKAEQKLKSSQVFVPCAPGDEGVALGCAVIAARIANNKNNFITFDTSILPFAGAEIVSENVSDSILVREWLTPIQDDALPSALVNDTAIVFWYQGRAEFGPRALGHRSILASPRDPFVVDYINKVIKGREDFRPLAPAVLAECAAELFEISANERSPFMSKVWRVRPEARSLIPACVHVDYTARPQTVEKSSNQLDRYRSLLEAMHPPVLLDTSFNTKRAEPIVETPFGAISSFLNAAARRPLPLESRNRKLLLSLADFGLYAPADCPIDLSSGYFPLNETILPRRRHNKYELLQTTDGFYRLRVLDLDEELEDPNRTGRGDFYFKDTIEAELYVACDGFTTASELAAAFYDEDEVSSTKEAEIYLRLARMWRATLVVLRN